MMRATQQVLVRKVCVWGEAIWRIAPRIEKAVGRSIQSADVGPSFALEETCCTLVEGETGFGYGI